MNVFHLIERLLDYYQYDLILSKNLVAIKYLYLTREHNDIILTRMEEEEDLMLMKMENDPVIDQRYAGNPIEDAIFKITEGHLYKSKHPVTTIEMTGILSPQMSSPSSVKQCSRVVPSIKIRVHMDDVGGGGIGCDDDRLYWPPTQDREFIEDFEGKQRRRLLENMSKYGTEHVPTPWEDSCVRRTVREMMSQRTSTF